jgi:RNA polymerase sigma-70 factor, ECF subfamily
MQHGFLTEAPHHLDDLYNLSYYLTCSSSKAEKLLYKVIREASDFKRYHEPADIRKWLIRITLNLYNRFYLVPGIDQTESEIRLTDLPQHADRFFIEDSFKNMREGDILKLLSLLPSVWREVLVLREVLNLTYELISELLDIPESSVIMRLTRGRYFIYSQIAESR